MDFYSRKIIGWAYGTTMTADLAVKAVENACLNVSDTSGIILHSDLEHNTLATSLKSILLKRKSTIRLVVRAVLTIIHA